MAVSVPRENALKAAGQPVPAPVLVKALIDTGASITGVDYAVIAKIGLARTGFASVLTPSTGAVAHQAPTYDVRLIIPAAPGSWIIPAIAVVGSTLKQPQAF